MASAITYHPPLAPTEIQRQIPSVGAVCGEDDRTALCGGREVTCVPTATAWYDGSTQKGAAWRLCPRVGGGDHNSCEFGSPANAWANARFGTGGDVLAGRWG